MFKDICETLWTVTTKTLLKTNEEIIRNGISVGELINRLMSVEDKMIIQLNGEEGEETYPMEAECYADMIEGDSENAYFLISGPNLMYQGAFIGFVEHEPKLERRKVTISWPKRR